MTARTNVDWNAERTVYAQLGKQIREARIEAGLRQEDLARYIGMTRSSVANIETGRQHISAYTLLSIHGLLGITFDGLAPDPERRVDVAARGRLVAENETLRRRIVEVRKLLAGAE